MLFDEQCLLKLLVRFTNMHSFFMFLFNWLALKMKMRQTMQGCSISSAKGAGLVPIHGRHRSVLIPGVC